jgi:hypothetical protein
MRKLRNRDLQNVSSVPSEHRPLAWRSIYQSDDESAAARRTLELRSDCANVVYR